MLGEFLFFYYLLKFKIALLLLYQYSVIKVAYFMQITHCFNLELSLLTLLRLIGIFIIHKKSAYIIIKKKQLKVNL